MTAPPSTSQRLTTAERRLEVLEAQTRRLFATCDQLRDQNAGLREAVLVRDRRHDQLVHKLRVLEIERQVRELALPTRPLEPEREFA